MQCTLIGAIKVPMDQLVTIQLRFGAGVAPSTGDAAIGTPIGLASAIELMPGTSYPSTQTFTAFIGGLTVGRQYWFDASMSNSAGAITPISNITLLVTEF